MQPDCGVTDIAEISEAALLIRYAARKLLPSERAAVLGFLAEEPMVLTGQRRGITRGGIFMAREAAFRKMARELRALGIEKTEDLITYKLR